MRRWILATLVAVLAVVAGLAGYLVWSGTRESYPSTEVNPGGDVFTIPSLNLVFSPQCTQGERALPPCFYANLTATITNTGTTPITGINISTGGEFYNMSWDDRLPLQTGKSISGSLVNVETTFLNRNSNLFSVIAVFADGNATTANYQWPDGNSSILQVQPYCCRDSNLNVFSCNRASLAGQIAEVRPQVVANPAFVAQEKGINYTFASEGCGQDVIGVGEVHYFYDNEVFFYFVHTTPQQYDVCGRMQNQTDYLIASMLLTPAGYSLPSLMVGVSSAPNHSTPTCVTTT